MVGMNKACEHARLGLGGVLVLFSTALAQPAEVSTDSQVDRPPLALIGTIIGGGKVIAFFVSEQLGTIISLKPGEHHAGWLLQSVKPREASVQQNSRTVRLNLLERPGQPKDLSPRVAPIESVPTAFKAPASRNSPAGPPRLNAR